jgi:hypothetical protein
MISDYEAIYRTQTGRDKELIETLAGPDRFRGVHIQ